MEMEDRKGVKSMEGMEESEKTKGRNRDSKRMIIKNGISSRFSTFPRHHYVDTSCFLLSFLFPFSFFFFTFSHPPEGNSYREFDRRLNIENL